MLVLLDSDNVRAPFVQLNFPPFCCKLNARAPKQELRGSEIIFKIFCSVRKNTKILFHRTEDSQMLAAVAEKCIHLRSSKLVVSNGCMTRVFLASVSLL